MSEGRSARSDEDQRQDDWQRYAKFDASNRLVRALPNTASLKSLLLNVRLIDELRQAVLRRGDPVS
jgi:hypothetical protein